MVASVEVQTRPLGQPLPPVPRQPGVQRETLLSQTRPESVAPQSLSVMQPQLPFVRHAPPLPPGSQVLLVGVHSTHVRVPFTSHTSGGVQCASLKHWTHTCGWFAV